jgi:hypothetical protein
MPKFDNDRSSPQPPPVRPPTLPLDFPDIPQKPGSELQPPPDPSAAQDHVAETTSASDEPGEADMTKDEWRRKNVRLREKIREVLEQHPELRDATDEIALKQGTQVRVAATAPLMVCAASRGNIVLFCEPLTSALQAPASVTGSSLPFLVGDVGHSWSWP